MSKLKLSMMMGVCGLVAGAVTLPAGPSFAATIKVNGGGSSLIAPYWREAMDCYGHPNPLVFNTSPPTLVSEPGFNYTGSPAQNCSSKHVKKNIFVRYVSTGSGTGIKGVYSGDPTLWGYTNAAGTTYWPGVQYGMSDNSLAASDVLVYNKGGVEQGLVFVGPGQTPGSGQYANPKQKFGALVQFPASIDPVAIAYSPVYEVITDADGNVTTSYTFQIHTARTGGGLRLNKDAVCKIFNGQITDWNDPELYQLNGNNSLKDPTDPAIDPNVGGTGTTWSVPLQITGRSDSSGTSSIFTRFLSAVCPSVVYSSGHSNQYSQGSTTLPSTLTTGGVTYNKSTHTMGGTEVPGKFTIASGSDGVAEAIAYPNAPGSSLPDSSTIMYGRIGYIGPDYVAPADSVTSATPYVLNSADVQNVNNNKWYAPTAANALLAFGSLRPPQSNADGTYNPSSTDRNRKNPQDWVEPPVNTSVLANPRTGYPIVGTTNFMGYTCYSNKQKVTAISGAWGWYVTSPTISDSTKGLLGESGLAPLPAAWDVAIHETFVTNDSHLNLNFAVAGDTSKQCKKATTGG